MVYIEERPCRNTEHNHLQCQLRREDLGRAKVSMFLITSRPRRKKIWVVRATQCVMFATAAQLTW